MAILTFHNTDPKPQIGLNNYHPKRLENVLENLINAGYEFVGIDDYLDNTDNPRKISLTFDDGYETFHTYAFPILTRLEIPAIVFIPPAFIGRRADWDYAGGIQNTRHLDEKQIRQITATGISIGSHGYSHINLPNLPERMLGIQLERSKKHLEDLTGREIKYISYPFGRFDDRIELAAAKCGYRNGFSLSYLKTSRNHFTHPRFCVYTLDTTFSIMKKLDRGGVFNYVERVKGAVLNSYAAMTIALGRFRSRNLPV